MTDAPERIWVGRLRLGALCDAQCRVMDAESGCTCAEIANVLTSVTLERDAALAVLQVCKDQAESDLMFPSYRAGACITDTAIAKALNVLGEAGRPHGFRTSFRTWVQDTGACGYDVAETVLGHQVGGKVERTYARSDLLEPRRVVMQRWGAFVTATPAQVIQIRR